VGKELEAVHLRAALQEAMRLSSEVNKYLDVCAPWFEIKKDKNLAAKSVFTALKAIDYLKIMFAPFLPFSSERLHTFLGYTTLLFGDQYMEDVTDNLGIHKVLKYRGVEGVQWQAGNLQPGNHLLQPSALFTKLDEKLVEEERNRLIN
jgi:methionyl-tRNA synthetase